MTLETKEHAALSWPEGDAPWPGHVVRTRSRTIDGHDVLATARDALAAEWRAANPQTPAEVERFYQQAQGIAADLDAWHATPERAEWTRMLVHVATQAAGDRRQATEAPLRVVDIGCGAGHDLLALREALPEAVLWGVEPNVRLRSLLGADERSSWVYANVDEAPIEKVNLLVCIDVLEHIPDPETFLAGIAQRASVGCLLFETTATHDAGTPLHLPANRGWHPGRVLERHGWELADHTGRVRVWRRTAEAGRQRASVLLCAYRNVTVDSLQSIMALTAGSDVGWRLKVKSGDALIARSRSVLLTEWWRSTADDVCLLVDDDLTFAPSDADHVTELCRNGYDIIAGAYPVRDGSHLALRYLDGTTEVQFGPNEPPMEIRYPATGFVAIHRRVIDALVAGAAGPMPLLHPREVWSFYGLFPTMVIDDGEQGPVMLSEDWALGELVRRAGFKVWLDPTVRLQHASSIPISVQNMGDVHNALLKA